MLGELGAIPHTRRGMTDEEGLLFDIQGFSVHDGPGCRTTVFMKGCPLRCGWCSNPEGIGALHPELMHYRTRCTGDGACIGACPRKAISRAERVVSIDREKCGGCREFACVKACNHGALKLSGFHLTVEQLMGRIQKDRQYWGSGGGVTLSGGEPMLQPQFAAGVLRACYDSYIHTALETCGYAPWSSYETVLDHVDWLFFDIKHMEPKIHKRWTCASNRLILENAGRMARHSKQFRMIFRMVVVPGVNDSAENIEATAKFIGGVGKTEINILPLHHLGSTKYELLGRDYYACRGIKPPTAKRLEEIKRSFESHSITCYIGGLTPF